MSLMNTCLALILTVLCPAALQAESSSTRGATEKTPSLSQYFSWINNRNEGATESQTLANLEFFKWLHDDYGMKLDIYAFDAGIIDGPRYYGTMESRKFKSQFPNGLDPIYKLAKSFDCRLGVWLGPDGYGNTPQEEQARRDLLVKLCRDYDFALFKMDAVCTQLRPEKQDAFAKTMIECRKHSPDLILLNHRLELGHAEPHATTFLWEGAETYIDVHMTNKQSTGTHNRVAALSRGLVPKLQRLTEDHGVCISSCPDYWDDDLILQAFNRNLILAPEVYGNPWFLRDEEFPKLARIYNLTRRYRDILVEGMVLDAQRYGPLAVARGNGDTRLVTMRNLEWEPSIRKIKLDASMGLAEGAEVEVRQFHPTERILGNFKFGDEVEVEVLPFRASLVLVDRKGTGGAGVKGVDYEVVRDVPGKPIEIKVLGKPGTKAVVEPVAGYGITAVDGNALRGNPSLRQDMEFGGTPLKLPWHRHLGVPKVTELPKDSADLFEAACFAVDNECLELRSLHRSGPTRFPAVQKAREAFLQQPVMKSLGILQQQLIDRDSDTHVTLNPLGKRADLQRLLRLDLGAAVAIDQVVFELAYDEIAQLEAELPAAEVSTDLKHWKTVPMTREGLKMAVDCAGVDTVRYLRSRWMPERIAEIKLSGRPGGQLVAVPALPALKLTWLQPEFRQPLKAWSLPVRLDEAAPGSYLTIACNGKHGVDGAWVALRVGGRIIGAPTRAPSFPVNPFENGVGKAEQNCSFFIPVTADMIGKDCELVVMGFDKANLDFNPDVWITAYPIPHAPKMLTLQRN